MTMTTELHPAILGSPLVKPRSSPSPGRRSQAIQFAIFAVTVLAVIGPLLPIFYQSFIDRPLYATDQQLTLQNYVNLSADPAFLRVVVNTITFAVLSTLVAQIAGVAFAVLVGRTDMPGRKLVGGVILWPLFLSPLLLSMGWFILYGPAGYVTMTVMTTFGFSPWNLYSLAGMSLVAGVAQAPVTLLYCLASAALADSRMEDAARSVGASPWRTLRHVTLPMLSPAIMFSGVLNFMNALESLSIPLIFGQPAGIKLFMTFIYEEAFTGSRPNYGIISASATVLLAVIATLIWLQKKLLGDPRRFNSVSGKAGRVSVLQAWRMALASVSASLRPISSSSWCCRWGRWCCAPSSRFCRHWCHSGRCCRSTIFGRC